MTVLVTAAAAFLIGLAPGLQVPQRRLNDVLREGGTFSRSSRLRNLLVMQAGANPKLLLDVTGDEQVELESQAGQVSAAQLTALFELVQGAVVKVRRAAQPRLTLEVALLSAIHLAPTDDLADLLAEVQGRPRAPREPRAPRAPREPREPSPPQQTGGCIRSDIIYS